MVRYAALCFAEDENIADRTYWYRCPFAVAAGEKVFAPVGPHDRIQRAEVVRVCEKEQDVSFDVRFLKRVAAKCGAFRRSVGGTIVFETGGLAYDEKHFTRFGRVLFGTCEGAVGGVTPVAAQEECAALRTLLRTEGCALLTGRAAADAAADLLLLAGVGEADIRTRFQACGTERKTAYSAKSEQTARERLAAELGDEDVARLANLLR